MSCFLLFFNKIGTFSSSGATQAVEKNRNPAASPEFPGRRRGRPCRKKPESRRWDSGQPVGKPLRGFRQWDCGGHAAENHSISSGKRRTAIRFCRRFRHGKAAGLSSPKAPAGAATPPGRSGDTGRFRQPAWTASSSAGTFRRAPPAPPP